MWISHYTTQAGATLTVNILTRQYLMSFQNFSGKSKTTNSTTMHWYGCVCVTYSFSISTRFFPPTRVFFVPMLHFNIQWFSLNHFLRDEENTTNNGGRRRKTNLSIFTRKLNLLISKNKGIVWCSCVCNVQVAREHCGAMLVSVFFDLLFRARFRQRRFNL